jgi:hypothetical protein
LAKYKKEKNANISEDYESLLIKEEASLRQHIALENKFKLDYEILNEKINSLETENNLLKNRNKEQMIFYESKIEELNKQIIDITNLKSDIQNNERKLRKKLDLKEKEIFQLQTKLNSLNYNNGANSNNVKIMKHINYNSSFCGKDNTFKEYKKIKKKEKFSNNNISIVKNNRESENNEKTTKRGRNKNVTSLNSNSSSVHHNINKYNSISKINNVPNFFEQDYNAIENNYPDNETIIATYNKNYIFNNLFPFNGNANNEENISNIQKNNNKDNIENENQNNNNKNSLISNYKDNTLNYSANNNKKEDKNTNINKGNPNIININNSIDLIRCEQKSNNYRKINENKLLLFAQNKSNKLKRTFSAIRSEKRKNKINFNSLNSNNQVNQNNKKEKMKLKRDITPDKLNYIISNNTLKINENTNKKILYLLKKTPKKDGYKNSMPNIKGINVQKNNNRENNNFQFLSNKMNSNNSLNGNYKGASYSQIKINDYKKISPRNKICNDETNYNFNNTNIINNKIIQKEGDINNNIIIINGELSDLNNNKDEYPLISINKNNISLKRVSLKNTGRNYNK